MAEETAKISVQWVRWALKRGRAGVETLDPDAAWEAELKGLPPGASLIWNGHSDYPAPLLDLAQPPEFLYSIGRPGLTGRELAVVGSRSIDSESTRVVTALCDDLVAAHLVLVSGGALGVDTIAHQAAGRRNGRTIVVLPSGLDIPTPRSNARLFKSVVENDGWILSEYPLGVKVRKHFFHRRNQLIAALAGGVVLMRARESGGTHITARAAVELGRPLFAVPGSPEDRFSVGCNDWIRRDARCAWTCSQILNDLGWADRETDGVLAVQVDLSDAQVSIVQAIRFGHRDLNAISQASGLSTRDLQIEILGLEILGVCTRDPAAGEYRLGPVQIDTSALRR